MADPVPPNALAALDKRSREIFREIVESYLETGEPVGSRTLSKKASLSLSPASIRNTMADLEALGLLDSPHAMAGRRPTQSGLRFFIDSLLELGDLNDTDRRDIDKRLSAEHSNMEDTLNRASEFLSGLAGGAGLVLTPKHEAPVKHVELVSIGAEQALAVIVFEDGSVENRVMSTPADLAPAALQEATNYLNARFKGKTLAEARNAVEDAITQDRAALNAAAASLVQGGLAEWSGEDPQAGRSLIVRGRANLLQDAEALGDLERVRRLFDDLEKGADLVQLLDIVRQADSVRIYIGSENPLFSLSGSSLVVAPYMNAQRRVVGALGVIGPTRLNYARVIPVVDYTARVIGRMLDRTGSDSF
jgi:heat-inducible transcriptional repressor